MLQQRLAPEFHGDFSKWQTTLQQLPAVTPSIVDLNRAAVRVGQATDLDEDQHAVLQHSLRQLHPWRKGPFDLFGIHIETEWRSDWKWDRLKDHIAPLTNRAVLDIGCGSGYHCWRMRGAGARFVLGIDPTLLFVMQFLALQHYIRDPQVQVLPLGMEDLPPDMGCFDTVFSMGHGEVLVPDGRYAQMRNVWAIPSVPTLVAWLQQSGFRDVRCVDASLTSMQEQRRTDWMQFQSLSDFLDPKDPGKTVEGYPAPVRAICIAKR